MTLVNTGTINANGGATNTGTIEATAGATLLLFGTTIANAGGTISANPGILQLTNSTINGGVVTLTGASTLQLTNGVIHGGSTLTNSATGTIEALLGTNTLGGTITNPAGGVLKIDEGAILNLENGSYPTLGTVTLNAVGLSELVVNGANVTLSGGTVAMSNNFNNYILGAATADTLTNQETIQGAGHIGNGPLTLVNTGTMNANQSAGMTFQVSGGVTNTGTIEATAGATLLLFGNTVTNAGGTILANPGILQLTNSTVNGGAVTLTGASTLQLTNGVIHGGSTLTNSATGTIEALAGTNTLGGTIVNPAGGQLKIDDGAILNLENGTYPTLGSVALNSSGSLTELLVNGASVTLSGGSVTLTNNANNYILGAAAADILTNQETIQGAGHIGNGGMGLVNTGTILANQSVPLIINTSSAGFNNTGGTLSVSTGDTLQITSNTPFQNFSGTTLTGGTYNVSGTLQFGASGTNLVTNAANITLTGAGSQIIDAANNNVLANFATNAAAGTFTLGAGRSFTTAGNFTNSGALAIGAGDTFKVNGNLTNFAGTTLTGGTYNVTGALQFNGANIVTNAAKITLTGAGSTIISDTSANALANFATNAGGATFTLGGGRSFTTGGNFTNHGTLTVGGGDNFNVNGNLTNFAGTTLTGGTYAISGTLQFNNANIVTNAAKITLTGAGSKIVNQPATDALASFASNTVAASFTLAGNRSLTTAGGSFTNAGIIKVSTGSTFTVGGTGFNFTQTGGTTTVDGTLTAASPGTLNLNGGALFGAGTIGDTVVDSATITPGDSATKTGILTVSKPYTQNTGGALDISLAGTTVGTKYDQLNVTQAATLAGTLNISLVSGFVPTIGSTFDILNGSTVTGTFGTVNGLSINGTEHFTVTYNANDVILTVVAGLAPTQPQVTRSGARGRWSPGLVPSHSHNMALVRPPKTTPHRRMDFPGAPVSQPAVTAGPESNFRGLAPLSASSFNSVGMQNHRRLEIVLDWDAMRKTSPKRLLKALFADSDSPDSVSIGYVSYTPSH